MEVSSMSKFKLVVIITIFISFVLLHNYCFAARYHSNRRRGTIRRSEVVTTTRIKEVVPVAIPEVIGPKKLIAVAEFENKSNWAGQVNLGTGMADQLITALMDTKRFIVLERDSIDAVLREQDFGASSRTTGEGGAKIGKISRAQILIQGAVTEFDQSSSSGAGGVTVKGFTFSASEAKAHVAVDLRIYDTTTGQIIASKACKGTAKSSGGSFGYAEGDFGFSAGGEARTPLDYAVRDAINQAVHFIVLELQNIPWSGSIAMVKDDNFFLNCGRTTGIMVADQFSVWKPGESIIDPETGLNLGSENTKIGEVEVIKVDEKFSKVVPIAGTGFERGDIVKYNGRKPPEPPPTPVIVE